MEKYEFIEFIKTLNYKPGSWISVALFYDSVFNVNLERAVHDSDIPQKPEINADEYGTTVKIPARLPFLATIRRRFTLDVSKISGINELKYIIRREFRELECHEVDEWLRSGEERIMEPHPERKRT